MHNNITKEHKCNISAKDVHNNNANEEYGCNINMKKNQAHDLVITQTKNMDPIIVQRKNVNPTTHEKRIHT
jgi:hypothetical protein